MIRRLCCPAHHCPSLCAVREHVVCRGPVFRLGCSGVRKFDATTGVPDASFDAAVSFDAVVYDLALSGNALYVAGDFQHMGSQARPGVVELDATTGALDATFAPPGNWSVSAGGIRALQLLNGSLYVAANLIVSGGRAAMRIRSWMRRQAHSIPHSRNPPA